MLLDLNRATNLVKSMFLQINITLTIVIAYKLRGEVVLVGGWTTYLQAQNMGSRALPSLGIFIPVGFGY